jgi:hypothetical protein
MSDELVDKYDIDQHDEIGYEIARVAYKLIKDGYEAKTIANRLRVNADMVEKAKAEVEDGVDNE